MEAVKAGVSGEATGGRVALAVEDLEGIHRDNADVPRVDGVGQEVAPFEH